MSVAILDTTIVRVPNAGQFGGKTVCLKSTHIMCIL